MKHPALPFIAVLLVCLMSPAWAGNKPPAHFAATFVQTRTLPGFDQPLTSHGVVRVSKDGGFYWEINRPYHYLFAMHDGKAYEELPNGTRRILKPEQTPWLKTVQRIFVSALSGNRERLERWFNIEIKPRERGRHITLVPTVEAMAKVIERIEVTENAAGQPRYVVVEEASGARITIRFTPIDHKPEAP